MIMDATRSLTRGLGRDVEGLMTSTEIADKAFNFSLSKKPVYYKDREDTFHKVKGTYGVFRNDTGECISAPRTVGEQYEVIQPKELLQFVDLLSGDPRCPLFETAGVMYGGRAMWLTARLNPEMVSIVPGDDVQEYLLAMTKNDGSGSLMFKFIGFRMLCANAFGRARKGLGRQTKVRHSGDVLSKVETVGQRLGIVLREAEESRQVLRDLANVSPTKEEIDSVLHSLYPDTGKTARQELQRQRVLHLFEGAGKGSQLEGVRGTAWGLYNAITELEDWHNGMTSKREDFADWKLENVLVGSGAQRKEDALDTIVGAFLG